MQSTYLKGLVPKIHKEFSKLNRKNPNNTIKIRAEDMKRYVTEESIEMSNKHKKKTSTSLVIWVKQIKTTMRYHYTPSEQLK